MAPTTDPSTVFPAPFTDAMIMSAALCSSTTSGAGCRSILTPHGAAARDAYEKQCRPSKCPDLQKRYDQVMADHVASRKDYVQAGEDLQTCGINACPAQFVAAYSMVCVQFTEPALQAYLTPSRLLTMTPSYVPGVLQAEWNQTRHIAQVQGRDDARHLRHVIAPVMYQTENDRSSVGPLVTNSTPPQLFINKARIPASGVLGQTFPLNFFTPGPCVNGVIASPRFMDDACTQDAECLLGSCYGNVCRAKTRSLLAAGVFDAVSNATLASTNAGATNLPTDDLLGVLPTPTSISPVQIALIVTAPVLLILLALAVWRRQLHVDDDDDDDTKSGVVVVDAIDPTAPAAREARLSPADPRMLDDVESAMNSRRSSMSGIDLSLPNYSPYSALRPLPSTAPPSYPPSTRSTMVGAFNGGPNITAMSSLRHEVDIPPWASPRGTPRPSPRISPRPSPRASVESTASTRRSAYDDRPWESAESFEMTGARRRRGVTSRPSSPSPGSHTASPRRSTSREPTPIAVAIGKSTVARCEPETSDRAFREPEADTSANRKSAAVYVPRGHPRIEPTATNDGARFQSSTAHCARRESTSGERAVGAYALNQRPFTVGTPELVMCRSFA
ncbi:hypothetical protein AMAG_10264 [Allomyces macrogynus ATCC 38327]|uniref:Uncharacterized protein n=1 Tax=Allomyces macrogynus (strain ATCC 38327) TaxID=578462 RepID=A0A0L0STX4_ALLM3|nr:hypothetical protein AMAG_10264 [Allomyces macrogynus ATCC 38327]|eukprot:KNE65983.1 hypothetical protein AMAG_10264 [Allomyces macrogynus ATCC 38327]